MHGNNQQQFVQNDPGAVAAHSVVVVGVVVVAVVVKTCAVLVLGFTSLPIASASNVFNFSLTSSNFALASSNFACITERSTAADSTRVLLRSLIFLDKVAKCKSVELPAPSSLVSIPSKPVSIARYCARD